MSTRTTRDLLPGDTVRAAGPTVRTLRENIPPRPESRWHVLNFQDGTSFWSESDDSWELHETPPDDLQQVQSRRATSLAAIQTAKYPRDALYALLRAANQDVLHLLATKGMESHGVFTVTVEVRTTARPQGSPDA